MNLFSALALLFGASLKNRVRRQIRRLRQPRFLIATVAGLFYFWQVLFRRWYILTQPVPDSPIRALVMGDLHPLIVGGLLVLVSVQVVGGWVFGDDRAQLAFTESEVQFFFPAPASRLSLVHYKLARSLMWLMLGALISAAFIGRLVSPRPLLFTLGAWIGLTAVSLHRIAASFTRDRVAQRGPLARGALWAGLAALGAGVLFGIWRSTQGAPVPIDDNPLVTLAASVTRAIGTAPASWILWPLRALLRLALAPDGGAFLRALPAALGVLATQYLWVVLTVTPFEEASAEAAELRGRMLEARQSRTRAPVIKNRRALWSLSGTGRPEVALAWKNGLAVLRQFQARGVLLLVFLALALLIFIGRNPEGEIVRLAMSGAFVVMLMLFGPIRLTLDMRHDIPRIDMLRALPLGGKQIVFAELLAPAAILTVFEWLLIALAVAFPVPEVPLAARLGVGTAAALLAPSLTVVGLVIQNAAALLFPEWMTVFRERRRGFDAMGQRLLTLVGSAAVIAVGAIPAAVIGGGLWLLLSAFTPLFWSAAPIAAAVASVVLLVESAIGIAAVGKLFEAHDVSAA